MLSPRNFDTYWSYSYTNTSINTYWESWTFLWPGLFSAVPPFLSDWGLLGRHPHLSTSIMCFFRFGETRLTVTCSIDSKLSYSISLTVSESCPLTLCLTIMYISQFIVSLLETGRILSFNNRQLTSFTRRRILTHVDFTFVTSAFVYSLHRVFLSISPPRQTFLHTQKVTKQRIRKHMDAFTPEFHFEVNTTCPLPSFSAYSYTQSNKLSFKQSHCRTL
jgi:hypothetical protein